MSEHNPGKFLREHKKLEIAAGVGVIASGAVAAGTTAFLRRKKRQHEMQTNSGDDLSERAKILNYENEAEATPSLQTIIAGKSLSATTQGGNDGIQLHALYETDDPQSRKEIDQAVNLLMENQFIASGTLLNGEPGLIATPDLNQVARDGLSEALATYFYYSGGA